MPLPVFPVGLTRECADERMTPEACAVVECLETCGLGSPPTTE